MKKEERKYAESREEYFREFHSVIAPVVVVDDIIMKESMMKNQVSVCTLMNNGFY